MKEWKSYLLASVAGILTTVQLLGFFFLKHPDGIQVLRWLGWIIWAISVIFGIVPIFAFKKQGGVAKGQSYVHTTVLVDTGLYGIVRHPQYLAGILLNLGLMLISQHWLIIAVGLPPMILMYIDILKADQQEIKKFGEDYRRYMQRVPRVNFVLGLVRLIFRKKTDTL